METKKLEALERLWTSGQGHLLVESCASKHCLRPRLAKALEEEGLLTVEDTGALCGFKVARLTGEGVDFCLEHFEE